MTPSSKSLVTLTLMHTGKLTIHEHYSLVITLIKTKTLALILNPNPKH